MHIFNGYELKIRLGMKTASTLLMVCIF